VKEIGEIRERRERREIEISLFPLIFLLSLSQKTK